MADINGHLGGKGILATSEMDQAEALACLGFANGTICSHLSQFCPGTFPTFPLSYWRCQFLLPHRKDPTPQVDEKERFESLGPSNGTICNPLKPICSENIPTFPPSYCEANSNYPRGPIVGKGKSHNSKGANLGNVTCCTLLMWFVEQGEVDTVDGIESL